MWGEGTRNREGKSVVSGWTPFCRSLSCPADWTACTVRMRWKIVQLYKNIIYPSLKHRGHFPWPPTTSKWTRAHNFWKWKSIYRKWVQSILTEECFVWGCPCWSSEQFHLRKRQALLPLLFQTDPPTCSTVQSKASCQTDWQRETHNADTHTQTHLKSNHKMERSTVWVVITLHTRTVFNHRHG